MNPQRGPQRFIALDGVRGLAALIVVVHHSLLFVPAVAAAYLIDTPPITGPERWLIFSPLHLLWLGVEAVIIFFVLSGLVLTLPFLNGTVSWQRYYPQRMIRLWLPGVASVLFAVALVLLVAHDTDPSQSWYAQAHPTDATFGETISALNLLQVFNPFNVPVWSLRYEILFSLFLPLFVLLLKPARKHPVAVVLGLAFVTFVGDVFGNGLLVYLPMFGVGVVLALHLSRIITALRSAPRFVPPLLFVVSLGLLNFAWWGGSERGSLYSVPVLFGAALLLVLAVSWRPLERFFGSRPVHWLGTRSFSIYLIHEPVLVALNALSPALVWIGIPVALLVGEGFFRLIERPAHRLARKLKPFTPNPSPASAADVVPKAS